ncbi:hypothetical protein H4S06_006057, partial [Coemansia sp. BCRC 34490]
RQQPPPPPPAFGGAGADKKCPKAIRFCRPSHCRWSATCLRQQCWQRAQTGATTAARTRTTTTRTAADGRLAAPAGLGAGWICAATDAASPAGRWAARRMRCRPVARTTTTTGEEAARTMRATVTTPTMRCWLCPHVTGRRRLALIASMTEEKDGRLVPVLTATIETHSGPARLPLTTLLRVLRPRQGPRTMLPTGLTMRSQ